MPRLRPFDSEVARAVDSIPRGMVTTYREIAAALGDPRAARAVAETVRRLGPALGIPWHRVVGVGGRVSPRAATLLSEEGVPVEGSAVPLGGRLVGAEDLDLRPILSEMREAQLTMAERLSLEDGFTKVELVAGVDVSYAWSVDEFGIPREVARAACVVVDRELRVVDGGTLDGFPSMPYVPTYLGFREVPLLAPLARRFDFDVLMADGHGVSHPRGAGEASHLGLVLARPALGVAKRRLVGWLRGEELVYMGRTVGWVLAPPGGKRPIYASPGHLISLESTRKVVSDFRGKYRIPEPLRLAHRLSRLPGGRPPAPVA